MNQGVYPRQPGISEKFPPPSDWLVAPDISSRQVREQKGNAGKVKVVYQIMLPPLKTLCQMP
jgi:hypothetical protein